MVVWRDFVKSGQRSLKCVHEGGSDAAAMVVTVAVIVTVIFALTGSSVIAAAVTTLLFHLLVDIAKERGHCRQISAEDGRVDLDEGPVGVDCPCVGTAIGSSANEIYHLNEPDDSSC